MIARWRLLFLLGFGPALAAPWACAAGGATSSGIGGATSTSVETVTSTTIVTGVGSGGGGASPGGNLGLACAQDSDCGAPLHCILPTDDDPVFGGGPAGGYCSATCATGADCPGFGSVCVGGANGMGDCLATCTLGPVLVHVNDPLSTSKCQGRLDVRCLPLPPDGTVDGCVPTCGEDAQCPTGEVCDPRNAVCVKPAVASTGLPNGSACNPQAATPECAGVCVNFLTPNDAGPAITLCTNACVLGGQDIATNPNCGGDKKGLCVYSPKGNGAGDYGFCAQACSAQGDCQNPDFWCFPIMGLTGAGAGMIMNGFCFGALACPNGAADCASRVGTTCTQTAGGPLCLSDTFPLPPGDGGTDGGDTDGGDTDGGDTDGGSTDAGDGG